MFGFSIVKTAGDSMSPAVLDGAYLLIKQRLQYIDGDIVYVKHPNYGNIVKRIVNGSLLTGFYIAGDNVASVSTEQMGIIKQSNIVGKVQCVINPPSSVTY